MFSRKKRGSRLGKRFDAAMERFIFHHQVLGFLVMFVGLPLLTLAAVCICTTVLVLPVALAMGWM